MSLLIDSDCRGGKHQSCFGGPCECVCHDAAKAGSMSRHPSSRPARRALDEDQWVMPAAQVAALASVASSIVERHRPHTFSAGAQVLTCEACSLLAGIPVEWPCPDRAVVGDLMPDPSNRLLPNRPGSVPGHLPPPDPSLGGAGSPVSPDSG